MISLNTAEQVKEGLIDLIFQQADRTFVDTEIKIYRQIFDRLTIEQLEQFESKYMLGIWGHFELQDRFGCEVSPLIFLKKYEYSVNFHRSFIIVNSDTVYFQSASNYFRSEQLIGNIVPINFDKMIEIMIGELQND